MHGAIDIWSFPAGTTTALLMLALGYARGWLRVRRVAPTAIPSLSPGRASAFLLGLGALWIAVASPLGAIGHELVSIHMVQHVLLGAVAPPLIWLSAPVFPLLLGLPHWLSRRTYATIARGPLEPLGRVVTDPLTSWLAATLTIIGWHVPAAFELAQRSESWHCFQNVSFFVTGLLFWWPVVQPWPAVARLPRPAVPLYLFAATLPCDALSAFLVFCDRVVYRQYSAEPRPFGISALADQATAGAFMWVAITFIYLVPALVMTVKTLSPAQQRPREHWVDRHVTRISSDAMECRLMSHAASLGSGTL
jgi:cytochrome c oxidase assembly factor CtaG